MKRKAEIIRRQGRISIEVEIPLQKKSMEMVKIKVSGSEVDWEKLCYRFDMRDGEGLRRMSMIAYIYIIQPVKEKIFNKMKARGVHVSRKGESELVNKLKLYAACMSVYLVHHMSLPEENWPPDLKPIIDQAKNLAGDPGELIDKRSKNEKLHPLKITYQLWKNVFNEPLKHIGMVGPRDFNNFKKTYIHKNLNTAGARHFLKSASNFHHLLDLLT